jgi:hypothetical protein
MTRTLYVCLAFVVAALSSPTAYGFCLEHPIGTSGGTLAKAAWPHMPVTYKIHDTGSATGPLGSSVQPDQASELAAVRAAFDEWAAANCANIQFTDGGLIDSSEPVNLQHTATEIRVYWARDTTEWGSTATTSIAKTWYNQDGSGVITAAGILLNAIDKSYSTTGATDRFDVQSVVATEVGRVLGLAAVTDAGAVMYPSFQMGNTDKRTLTTDDEAGAAYLYPGDNDGGSCNSGTPDTNCKAASQDDGGVPTQDDGGTTPHDGGGTGDGGGTTGDGGGTTGDGGAQACQRNSDCASNRCDIDTNLCVPAESDSGCSCTVGSVGRGGYLTLALLCLGLSLTLACRRRRR